MNATSRQPRVRKLATFRRTLQAIVFAGLPLAACDAGLEDDDGQNCERADQTRKVQIALPAVPELRLKLESCRVDLEMCMAVCREARSSATPIVDGNYEITQCNVEFHADSVDVQMRFEYSCVVDGRRPGGLLPMPAPSARDLAGAWLAKAAWLEAASIYAFVELARELEDRGAPAALSRAAMVAANDEIRHTQLMSALAHRYGAAVPEPVITPMAPRSLEAMAIENAVEGCVRETWGAVSALWQAHTAQDLEARRVFAAIAQDEIRHAQLAWSIDRWLDPQLSAASRAKVAAARAAAVAELRDGHDALPALGLPDADAARGLLARASASLWKGAHA